MIAPPAEARSPEQWSGGLRSGIEDELGCHADDDGGRGPSSPLAAAAATTLAGAGHEDGNRFELVAHTGCSGNLFR